MHCMKLGAVIAATCESRCNDQEARHKQSAKTLVSVLWPLAALFLVVLNLPVAQAADETASAGILAELLDAEQSLKQVATHNQYLEQLITNQAAARAALDQQLGNYRQTRPMIVPLMHRMIGTLAEFVELDLPFDLEARRARVQALTDNMTQPDVALARKFGDILDAYQVEMNYGREIDAQTGWLEKNGSRREVTFLRVGRLVLAYQAHDRSETGFFNPESRQWTVLPDSYRQTVANGIRIANKQAAPVLLRLPVATAGSDR